MNPAITEVHKNAKQEPYVRLLVCTTCKTIEKLPAYEGPPEHDVTLTISAERHGETHRGKLINVSVLHWESPTMQAEIIKQIWGGSTGLDVFGTNFYSTRDTFGEDALNCYQAHLRPKEGCPEFRSEKKRLLPGTDSERKELGLPKVREDNGPKVFLCDFCPVRSYYAHRFNTEKGINK